MTIIYYTEINLICITLMLLFANQIRYKSARLSSDSRVFNVILWTTVIMCASDMVAGICRGQFFTGARVLIEISNLIFSEAISVVSFLWLVYVLIKLKLIKHLKGQLFLYAVPFIAISIITLINPFTNWLFTIDENNLYTRNVGIYFHWTISWAYFVIATIIIAYKIVKERDKNKRKEIGPLLLFIIAPVVAAVIQMMFYGVTCFQVGVTISILVISLTEQNTQIVTDALTGLSNRYAFNKYWKRFMQHHSETRLFLMMIDINNFKQVNDKFGHMEGDRALCDIADAVRQSCEEATSKFFACRYGGDEFLIAGYDCRQDEIIDLKNAIHKKLEEKNSSNDYPYVLSVSMGTASGICMSSDDIDNLLCIADDAMYAEKNKLRAKV